MNIALPINDNPPPKVSFFAVISKCELPVYRERFLKNNQKKNSLNDVDVLDPSMMKWT